MLPFILSIVSGCPVSADSVLKLYKNSYIHKYEAERLLSFTNNLGPVFIIGAVGAGMLNSPITSIIGFIITPPPIPVSEQTVVATRVIIK